MKNVKPITDPVKKPSPSHEEIKSDFPLSEKDEVKKAEQNLQKNQKKTDR
ncbi:hypothetical protein [Mucilaginibacter sp. UYCu711]